jgi:serine/threonine-protein kinase
MANVYRARHVPMDRWVALKVLSVEAAQDTDRLKRFEREMKVSSRITHPNTVQVYDFGVAEGGELFLAMELLAGTTLTKIIEASGTLPAERVVAIGTQIASALAAAHAEQIVHRDLKPDNIMLVDLYGKNEFVKVLDFGIARFIGGAGLTAQGMIVGTPRYMAPEQTLGKAVDHRCDLYQLGLVLYTMAAGRSPFIGKNPFHVLEQQTKGKPPPLRVVVPGRVPEKLEALIFKLLEKSPDNRPQSAVEVVQALQSLALGPSAPSPSAAHTGSIEGNTVIEPDPQAATRIRGRRTLLLAGGAIVVVAALAAALLLR